MPDAFRISGAPQERWNVVCSDSLARETNMLERTINRRLFLKIPVFFPFLKLVSTDKADEHHFQYENVVGTSMDLVVWTSNSVLAERACQTVLDEIQRLTSILNTRDPASEISLRENSGNLANASRELIEVLDAYDYWERRTEGIFSIRPA